jgi:predicted outer membrane repeat protein
MRPRVQQLKPVSTEVQSSAFIKRSYKRGMAIAGTSGLVFGLGVTTSTPAFAEAPYLCDENNTAVAVPGNVGASTDAIADALSDYTQICLDGHFVINRTFFFSADIEVYGIGDSTISAPESGVFYSSSSDGMPLFDIAIRNLEIKDGANVAIDALGVVVENSTFSGNLNGAIVSYGSVMVSNSTFINNSIEGERSSGAAIRVDGMYGPSVNVTASTFIGNSAVQGGAISAFEVDIDDSTFVDNDATNGAGGAIYTFELTVSNSTFSGNSAVGQLGEGGAIYASTGWIYFSTFVNNLSITPEEGQDVPGNAIYKDGSLLFDIGANIFAGSSSYPQLGVGEAQEPSPFIDAGGNVFSTSSETELEILAFEQDVPNESTVFGASVTSIFGSSNPTLANHAPNTSGTQTFGLAPGSPALDIVPTDILENVASVDQRGATRTDPADAGSFEGVVLPASEGVVLPASPASSTPPVLAKTGAEIPLWMTLVAALSVTLGVAATSWSSRTRRRKA